MSLPVIQMLLGIGLLLAVLLVGLGFSKKDEKVEFGRIVNGKEVEEGELAYQASVQLSFGSRLVTSKPTHFCGGAFIGNEWVLTAAHCVRNQRATKLKVVGGTNDISDKTSPTYRVKKIIMYKYNDITKQNDIALINFELPNKNKTTLDSVVHQVVPISLCNESFDPQGRNCTVSGWGHLKSKGSSVPDKLRAVSVKVLHEETCQKMLSGYPWDKRYQTMLCAGGEDKDACQGDSGGPMVCRNDNGDACIAGIVSWGVGCATEGIPGVYTNVRKYNDWIRDHMSGMSDNAEDGNIRQGLLGTIIDILEAFQTSG